MAKNRKVLKVEALLVAGLVIAVVAFLIMRAKEGKYSNLLPQPDTILPIVQEEKYNDFSTWQRQESFQSVYHFYLPNNLQLKTVEEGKQFRVISEKNPDQPLISIEQFLYSDFQALKTSLDKQGGSQFGWTNAYGSSIFEYRTDVMTSFVVDKEKKHVMKLLATDVKYFILLENMTRTFQTTTPEEYIHGPWYANFNGQYKIRYGSDLEMPNENAFTNHAEWMSAKLGKIQLSTYHGAVLSNDFYELILQAEKDTEFPDSAGRTIKVIQELKVDGVAGKMYAHEGESGTIGVVWKKDEHYYVLSGDWTSSQTFSQLRNQLNAMVTSFRFLTDQERLH